MSQFVMPSLGADMESAVLMEWLVKEGDAVTKGQVIAEVETSKGVIEIEVFEEGIVEKLLVEPETDCKVGTPMAFIRTDNEETVEVIVSEPEPDKESTEPVKEEPAVSINKEKREAQERIKISPAARKRANELGMDITEITPKDGVIQLSQIEHGRTTVIKAPAEEEKVKDKVKGSDGMRQAIAAAMSRSNAEIPHYYLSTSINMTTTLEYLEELNKERSIKDRILPVAMLIRAVVLALKDVPQLNGFWVDNEHQALQ